MMNTLKGFITNMGKYNEGELLGEWITFPIDRAELQEVLHNIGCSYYDSGGNYIDTGYEEYFFTDFESALDVPFSEFSSVDKLNEIAEMFEDWDADVLQALVELKGLSALSKYSPYDCTLMPDIQCNYDLGYYYAIEIEDIESSADDFLLRYFNFESYGHDLSIELDGGFTSFGWLECH